MSKGGDKQRGGFVLGLIVGLLLGLGIALGVALYITKVPIPFVNKLPQRTAEQDAEEAQRNRNWDPNAPLTGKGAARAASGVVAPADTAPATTQAPATAPVQPPAPAPAAAPASVPARAADKPADKPAAETKHATEAKPAGRASEAKAAAADPFQYFVQAGAFTRPEEAEQQRARLAMQGFTAKVYEREQSGRVVHRVRIGPMDGRDEAEGLQRKLEAAGIENNLVKVQK